MAPDCPGESAGALFSEKDPRCAGAEASRRTEAEPAQISAEIIVFPSVTLRTLAEAFEAGKLLATD